MAEARGEQMRQTAYTFCQTFAAGVSGRDCLDKFFIQQPRIKEHGPFWATDRLPFLAHVFSGRRVGNDGDGKTCDDYYDLLMSVLAVEPDSLLIPPKESFAVDAELGIVTVKLHAKFRSIKTGKAWEEDFVYVLSDFDDDGKYIGFQQLWADPLSAWVAVGE
ncbi:uncharacterized protein KY384_008499 [Bacidia gigantensis]|uniref:uncharacterized protein n=1 Tax=Bacidia gigantensis TaxID=2732470 RepID=UPI001D04CE29|nr:uncharacterized protein KY384_008499 [Bacidia gigantensis]KAG8527070.1 hypothetical protein KY384_008499 [Bacidia gigantensis]